VEVIISIAISRKSKESLVQPFVLVSCKPFFVKNAKNINQIINI
jgi:hypothetical protein